VKRQLKEHKSDLRQLAEKRVKQTDKKRFIVQKGGFLFAIVNCAVANTYNFTFPFTYQVKPNMLRKMYLVPATASLRSKILLLFPLAMHVTKGSKLRPRYKTEESALLLRNKPLKDELE
jgi:hypothetical protein